MPTTLEKTEFHSKTETRKDRVMVEASDLTKRYEDGILALDHLNLKIHAGEIYCLLGANGAGKTTTINLFFDFIPPTSGQARINGIDCSANPIEAKKQAAYVSENVTLYGNFTARQNLELFTRLAGSKSYDQRKLDMAMRQVGLPERSFDQRVKTFSKGMRQKLGIAVAILKNAPVLILDEPTSGLDPKASSELVALLSTMRNEGKAILLSTHDVFRAKEIADVVGIMKEGVLIMERTKRELQFEDLEKVYLRYMEVN